MNIEEKVGTLGRILTTWQASANAGMPLIVLRFHLKLIHDLSAELLAETERMDPSTSVPVNPDLGEAASKLLSDYFHGHTDIPDTIEGLED